MIRVIQGWGWLPLKDRSSPSWETTKQRMGSCLSGPAEGVQVLHVVLDEVSPSPFQDSGTIAALKHPWNVKSDLVPDLRKFSSSGEDIHK